MRKNIFRQVICATVAMAALASSGIYVSAVETKNESTKQEKTFASDSLKNSDQKQEGEGEVIRELMNSIQTDWWTMKEKYPQMYGGGRGAWPGMIDSFFIEGHEGSFKGWFTVGDLQYIEWKSEEYCDDLIDIISDLTEKDPITTPEDDFIWIYDTEDGNENTDKAVWLSLHESPCQLWIGFASNCPINVEQASGV